MFQFDRRTKSTTCENLCVVCAKLWSQYFSLTWKSFTRVGVEQGERLKVQKNLFLFFATTGEKKFFSYFISLFNLCEQHKYRFRNVCSEYRMSKKELPWWYKNFPHIPFVCPLKCYDNLTHLTLKLFVCSHRKEPAVKVESSFSGLPGNLQLPSPFYCLV